MNAASAPRLARSAILALAATACGGPNCPPGSSTGPTRALVAELDDGGAPHEEPNLAPAYGGVPVAIYGTAPPPCR